MREREGGRHRSFTCPFAFPFTVQSFFVYEYVNRFAVNGYDEGRALVATPPPTMTFTHSEKLTLSANWGRISCQRIQKRSLFRLPPILFSKAGTPIRGFASMVRRSGSSPPSPAPSTSSLASMRFHRRISEASCRFPTARPGATSRGHNSVACVPGTDDWYVCHHRRPVPNPSPNHRVPCLDRLHFTDDHGMLPVEMT